MNDWIDFSALAKIVLVGLICGAGLPALFAVGLRALHLGAPPEPASASGAAGQPGADRVVGGSPIGLVAGALCFAVVLAAIGWGIYLIVSAS